ncbi:HlyD family efflux transporter periplasmic adaptor subunit [Hungatella hathewayi]|nr:HlyD family efflux transporter periplasmic adaptor subunit [Hungatella hathewayi]
MLPAGKNGRKKKLGKGKMTGKQKAVRAGVIVVLLIAAVVAVPKVMGGSKKASAGAAVQKTATVERRSITSDLSSSGTISPKDTYNVTALASGEVITADFEEGDQVEKGQVLYTIDASSMESELKSAQNSLERAQTSYDLAVEDYNEAVNDYSGNTYKSTETGFIKTLYIKAGDKVSGNTKIADIYNDKVMKIRVPFLSGEAAAIGAGNQGVVTLTETGEQLLGTVTSVSNMEETLTGGRLVRYVTLEVENPGGLTSAHTATVTIGDFSCALEGTFEASVDTVMSADLSSSVEVESMIVVEGDFVNKGTAIFRMSSKSADSLVRNYKDAMDKAQESLESAQSKVDSTQDSYENYTITAPISGTVITKSVKAGDKISGGGNSGAVTLATIYDLSQVTFEMSVDELDVQSVQVGQSVVVTADAFENQTFSGKVTNISLASSNSNGVTNYPVTVTLDEVGGLLPGMNVDGQIILEEAENALVVPVDSLMRGNKVYVKDDTVKEANGAVPAGFRSVEVETGLINDDFVEIVSGLSEGDVVYVAESSASSSFSMEMMMPGGGGNMGGAPGGGGNRGGQGGGPGGGRP